MKLRPRCKKPQQALVEIEKEPSEWGKFTARTLAYHALGREQDSNAALAELIAKHHTFFGLSGRSRVCVSWGVREIV
jgi:hypothetical protein